MCIKYFYITFRYSYKQKPKNMIDYNPDDDKCIYTHKGYTVATLIDGEFEAYEDEFDTDAIYIQLYNYRASYINDLEFYTKNNLNYNIQ